MSTETVSDPGQSDATALARRLGDAITDLPEYTQYVETQRAVEKSEEAQEKIAEFERAREEYMSARQSGTPSEQDLKTIQEAQSELNAVPEMADHLEAKSRLDDRLSELNDAISQPLSLDFGQEAGGCCEN